MKFASLIFFFLLFSSSADAAGIKWTDRFPFHSGANVVSRGTGAGGAVTTAYNSVRSSPGGLTFDGITGMVVNNVPVVFKPSRAITSGALADVAVGLVRFAGPAVIIGGLLAPLIYDEVKKLWQKPSQTKPPNNGACAFQFSMSPGTTVYGQDGSACRCECAPPPTGTGPHVGFPFSAVNNEFHSACGDYPFKVLYFAPPGSFETGGAGGDMIPASDADISTALRDYFNRVPNSDIDIFNRVKDSDFSPMIMPKSTPGPTTGPSSIPTVTTTTTTSTPAGPITEQKVDTTTITYSSPTVDSVTVTTTTTTTTTKPDGTTDTKTEERPPNETAPPAPALDICVEHPEIIACGAAGNVDDVDIPEIEKPFNISSEKTAAGSCPSPIQFTVRGYQYSLSWSLVCDFASSIRGIVLAIAWLSAAIFVFSVPFRS